MDRDYKWSGLKEDNGHLSCSDKVSGNRKSGIRETDTTEETGLAGTD